MNVLIVEDSSFMRKVLRNVLEQLGFENIWEAENGQEGVQKFKDNSPDLVLLDIVMEKMNGIEALKEIKETDEEVTAIMISAVGQEEMVNEALDSGAEEFIEKPFDNDEIKEKITELMDL